MNGWWKLLVLLLLGVSLVSTWMQLAQIQAWVNRGGRFTDRDGQALCERVAELEKHSIGFQQSGIVSPPCAFARRNP